MLLRKSSLALSGALFLTACGGQTTPAESPLAHFEYCARVALVDNGVATPKSKITSDITIEQGAAVYSVTIETKGTTRVFSNATEASNRGAGAPWPVQQAALKIKSCARETRDNFPPTNTL